MIDDLDDASAIGCAFALIGFLDAQQRAVTDTGGAPGRAVVAVVVVGATLAVGRRRAGSRPLATAPPVPPAPLVAPLVALTVAPAASAICVA